MWLDLCLSNLVCDTTISSLLLMISLVIVMDVFLFPYFSFFFHPILCAYAPFMDLVVFLHAAIILLHRHFLISLLTWLTGMSLWSRIPAQLLLSHIHLHPVQGYAFHLHSFSSMSWLCHSLFISTMLPFLKAVHLIPLITVLTHPCFHGHKAWTCMICISRFSTHMYIQPK